MEYITAIIALAVLVWIGGTAYHLLSAVYYFATEKSEEKKKIATQIEINRAEHEEANRKKQKQEADLRTLTLFAHSQLADANPSLAEKLLFMLAARIQVRLKQGRSPEEITKAILVDIASLRAELPPSAFKPDDGEFAFEMQYTNDPEKPSLIRGFGEFTLKISVPVPTALRMEHHWVCAKTRWGKSQFIEEMFLKDLKTGASIIVMDSQTTLLPRLSRIVPPDRLIYIDPALYAPSLKLFDFGSEQHIYRTMASFKFLINGIMGSNLTGKQELLFDSMVQLLAHQDNPTLILLAQMLGQANLSSHVGKLSDDDASFFTTEYSHYKDTREEVRRRIRQLVRIPLFKQMFAEAEPKIDLHQAMQEGKVILIETNKDLLAGDLYTTFGSIFLTALYHAVQSRPRDSLPCLVYIDEFHEYLKANGHIVEAFLDQAAKRNVGFVLLHQRLSHLSDTVYSALLANAGIKMFGRNDADEKTFASILKTDVDTISSLSRGQFAIRTQNTGLFRVRFGLLEKEPPVSEERYQSIIADMKERYGAKPDSKIDASDDAHDDEWSPY